MALEAAVVGGVRSVVGAEGVAWPLRWWEGVSAAGGAEMGGEDDACAWERVDGMFAR